MDIARLEPLMRRFFEAQPSDPLIQEQLVSHLRRRETASRLLDAQRIADVTRQELEAFLQDTDAWYGLRWNKNRFWAEVFGEGDERLPQVRRALAELVRRGEAGLTAADFRHLLSALPGIGPAYLSEILALRFPDRYWMWNKQVRDFFDRNGVDIKAELPWGKKGDEGEQYMAARRHIEDVRRALEQALRQHADYLLADLFMYWANQQGWVDPWAERIARLVSEQFTPERAQARREGEEQARQLLASKLGRLTEEDLRQCLRHLSADWRRGRSCYDRFMPALYGRQIRLMAGTMPALNRWVQQLWTAGDAELDSILDGFWSEQEVGGAGVSLPTAVLYLRDPQKYTIWLPVMSKGLQQAAGFQPGRWRTADGYRQYNAAAVRFRERYKLAPQALDLILWQIAGDGEALVGSPFPGFSAETFAFLRELAANNNTEWMRRNGGANLARYRQLVREPLRLLFEAVAPTLAALDPTLETEVKEGKVLARINKRFPDEEGPYHTYLWGAFCRKGQRRQADAQLYVDVHADHVPVGFRSAGEASPAARARFRRNLQQAPEVFLRLWARRPPDTSLRVGSLASAQQVSELRSVDDLKPLEEAEAVWIERRYDAADPIVGQPEFAGEVAELLRRLHPFFRFATADDPTQLLDDIDDEDDEEEDVKESVYSLEDLCGDTFLDEAFWADVQMLLQDKRQIVLYGPPGTGKTWLARQFARYWVDAANQPGGDVKVVQFHPSYAYEEFVEGIRPESVPEPDGRHELVYRVKKGIFRRFCEEALSHPERRYVLILDEINRGELPRIFGELLYLLEYRGESVVLPYSGELFAIPRNVHLIGTMNTADRSIALVDHALRRRFHFVAVRPSAEVLRAYFETSGRTEMIWVADLLEQVNRQLEADGIEWHLHIGHSHFMRPDLDEAGLGLIWQHSVLPTLEEYFYRQPERLKGYQLQALKETLGKA